MGLLLIDGVIEQWNPLRTSSPKQSVWTDIFANIYTYTSSVVKFWQTLLEIKVIVTRVDVSETFSADQLWFRILSGLFQRCSLPENLWTALIQLWTALKTEIFRAKNQRWNSAVKLWNRADSELNSADFLWNSSETGNFQSKKNQLRISAVSALIFPERKLIPTEAFLNSSHLYWFSPETTLTSRDILFIFRKFCRKAQILSFLEI